MLVVGSEYFSRKYDYNVKVENNIDCNDSWGWFPLPYQEKVLKFSGCDFRYVIFPRWNYSPAKLFSGEYFPQWNYSPFCTFCIFLYCTFYYLFVPSPTNFSKTNFSTTNFSPVNIFPAKFFPFFPFWYLFVPFCTFLYLFFTFFFLPFCTCTYARY